MENMLRLVLFLSFLLFPMEKINAQECTLRVGWEEWAPYIYKQDGQFHGSEYAILETIATDAGCRLIMHETPWTQALKELERGQLDLLYSASYTIERSKYAHFTIPYRHETIMLATPAVKGRARGKVSLSDWIEYRGRKSGPTILGVIKDSFYGASIDRILKNTPQRLSTLALNDDKQLRDMLKRKRIDGFLIEKGVAKTYPEVHDGTLQIQHVTEQPADPLHFMFSKQVSIRVVERFNKAIKTEFPK